LNYVQAQGDAEIEKQPDHGPLNYWGKGIEDVNPFEMVIGETSTRTVGQEG